MTRRFQILAAVLIPMLLVAGAIGDAPATKAGDPTSAPAYWLAKAAGNAKEGLENLPTRIVLLNMLGRAQAEAGDPAGARGTVALMKSFIGGGHNERAQPFELELLNSAQIEAGMTAEATATLERRMAMPPETPRATRGGFGGPPSTRPSTAYREFAVDFARLNRLPDADHWIDQQPADLRSQDHLDVAVVLIRAGRHDAAMAEIELARKSAVTTTRPAATRARVAEFGVFEPISATAAVLAFAGETDAAWAATTRPFAEDTIVSPVHAQSILTAAYGGRHTDVAHELARRGLTTPPPIDVVRCIGRSGSLDWEQKLGAGKGDMARFATLMELSAGFVRGGHFSMATDLEQSRTTATERAAVEMGIAEGLLGHGLGDRYFSPAGMHLGPDWQ